MISSVADTYQIHPQTLRLYERLGLLKPSRSDGNTRFYTDTDLDRLEIILNLTRDLGCKSRRGRSHPEHARKDEQASGRGRGTVQVHSRTCLCRAKSRREL